MKQFSYLPNERKEIKNFPVSLENENVRLIKSGYVRGTKNNPDTELFSFTFASLDTEDDKLMMLTDNILVPSYKFCTKDLPQPDGTIYTVDQQKDRIDQLFMSKLFHIATSYGVSTEELMKINYSSWEELGKMYFELLSKVDKNIVCYMKTVKNKKGYICLPEKGKFLKNMTTGKPDFSITEKEQKILDSFDQEGVVQQDLKL